MCCTTQTETCDGVSLGGASCQGQGYFGGQLACNSSCTLDTSHCTVCAVDARIVSCGSAPVTSQATVSLALASGHGQIAMAWITAASSGASLHFALFDSNLGPILETPCFGPSNPVRVALAATSAGWLLAVEESARESMTYTIVLDANGQMVGSRAIGLGSFPYLASGASDQTLLLTIAASSALQAALLDSSGAPAWTQTAFQNTIEAEYGSAVFAKDAFLVSARTNNGVRIVRIDYQGQIGAEHAPGGNETEYPQLTWLTDAQEGMVLFADFSGTPTMFLAPIDATGTALAAPVAITNSPPAYYNPCPIAPSGSDTIALLAGYSGQTAGANHIDIGKLTGIGVFSTGPIMVEKDPKLSTGYRLTTLGTDAYIAWITGGYPNPIGLARVTP
jgi:hypothetical protein